MTSVVVIDASVAIKWFIPEIHSEAAVRLRNEDHVFAAPDVIIAEMGNVLWKKVRRGNLTKDQAQRLSVEVKELAVTTVPSRELVVEACHLAGATTRSVYDCLYLALALQLGTRLITADERFARALSSIPELAGVVRSLP